MSTSDRALGYDLPQLKIGASSTDYALALALIFLSFSPAFNNEIAIRIALPVLSLVIIWFVIGGLPRSSLNEVGFVCLSFGLIFLMQIFVFSLFQLAYISFLLKIFCGACLAAKLRGRLGEVMLNAVALLAAISLVAFVAQRLTNAEVFPFSLPTYGEGDNRTNILIHTIVSNDAERNSGITWEPGAFGGLLFVALLLSPPNAFRVWFSRRYLVIVAALLTTMSSTTYIAAFVFVFMLFLLGRLSVLSRAVGAFVLAVAFSAAFVEVDFLGEKIASQMEDASTSTEFYGDRFSALLYDAHYISKHPIVGNGFMEETRWADHNDFHGVNVGHGNGFTGMTAAVGFGGIILYFWRVLVAGRRYWGRWGYSLTVVAVLTILSQGEHFLELPIFWIFAFLQRGESL